MLFNLILISIMKHFSRLVFVLIFFFNLNFSLVYSQSQNQSQNAPLHNKIVVGYYAQWAIYARDYNVSDIDASKLTHLMYAFFDVMYDPNSDSATIKSIEAYPDFQHTEDPGITTASNPAGNIGALKLLKQNSPHLKVLISLGGWTLSKGIPAAANSANGRKTLVESMVAFMKLYPFIDGFDIDWEFPVEGGIGADEATDGIAQPHFVNDHKNLVYLLKEMRNQFDVSFSNQHKLVTMAGGNNVRNLLSTHVGPGTQAAHGMTENIADYADFITFFGYDFGGPWFDKTSYNAPLYPSLNSNDPLTRTDKDPLYNGPGTPDQALDDLVRLYLDYLRIPKEKLVMGLPFYGRLYDGVEAGEIVSGLPGLYKGAPRKMIAACGALKPAVGSWDSSCSRSGSIGFNDLSQGVRLPGNSSRKYLDSNNLNQVSADAASNGWVRYWDATAKVPYLYNTTTAEFISYDDPQSINIKVNYALEKGLGGVMFWELSEDSRDDFGGQTFTNGHALISQIDRSLNAVKVSVTVSFKDPGNTAVEGVSVNLINNDGNTVATKTSNSSGMVTFIEVDGYQNYTMIYSKINHGFLPTETLIKSEDLSQNVSYTIVGSSNILTLSGTTTLNTIAKSAEVVLLDGQNKELLRSTSASDGSFSLSNVIGGLDYSLTAQKDYYTFETISLPKLVSTMSTLEIKGILATYTISGFVKDNSGTAISGVTLNLSGDKTEQVTTDVNGEYRFINLEAGKNYVLTPNKTNLNFSPIDKSVSELKENTTVDFVKNEGFIYGFVKDGQVPLEGIGVQLVLNWASSTLGYQSLQTNTDANGMYTFNNSQTISGATFNISDYAAYNAGGKVEAPSWLAKGFTLLPSSYTISDIPSSPTQYDFNTQQPAPVIRINKPNTSTVGVALGTSIELEAEITISPADENVSISSVSFELDGQRLTATQSGNVSTAMWTPTASHFNQNHIFTVKTTASNGKESEESFYFDLRCSGVNCPNVKPEIVVDPSFSTTFNQPSSFKDIPVEVTVTDSDGTIQNVTISVDGGMATNMTATANNKYTYTFTPTAYKKYSLIITATDNDGETTSLTKELNITNSSFVPLPDKVNVGYIHSWESNAAPFIYLKDVIGTPFNVVVYSFIETQNRDGFTPKLTINNTASNYLTGGAFDESKFIADIRELQDSGIPVLVSVGGQNGHVVLNTENERDIFVNGVLEILRKYGFDGLDIDFEGSSMNFGAGALRDFSYASVSVFPKLKNVIDAINTIDQQMGEGFHITAAPEVQYVQQGTSEFLDNWGSFLPVIHNIRNNLDYIHVQLYNIGATNGVKGLDGKNYYQGSPDLIVSACESLIAGFTTVGPQIQFQGLRPDQVAIGLPATDACSGAGGAAGGGYITPENVTKALNYLVKGNSFGGGYRLQGGPYPNLRGAMTWSVNWDRSTSCGSGVYEYSNTIKNFFKGVITTNDDDDNDGVKNDVDLCANTPSNEQADATGCSVSQTTTSVIDDLITTNEWNTFYFPNRWGKDVTGTRTGDFYTFAAFKQAIVEISKIEVLVERRCGTNQIKVTRTDKEDGSNIVISESSDYNALWNLSKQIIKERVDYSKFLTEGTLTERKRELAAFFSNIAHETTGGPVSNNMYNFGLYFLEEGGGITTPNNYVSASTEYPAVAGKSYHGRGPFS